MSSINSNLTYHIRQASFNEIKEMIHLANKEKWNPGLSDAFCYQQIDPRGFFVGYLGDELISCISNVSYANQFNFLGFYIVKKKYRHKGYGKKIWDHAINYSKGMNTGLDGVLAQQANYEQSGFKPAHLNERYLLARNNIFSYASFYPNIFIGQYFPVQDFLEYDHHFFPCPRPHFLTAWLTAPHHYVLAYYERGKLRGYGVIRRCEEGFKIAPLLADNSEIADEIFQLLCTHVFPAPVIIDIPTPNTAAKELVNRYNMQKVFETIRMYTHTAPNIALDKIFGITSFEVG